MMKKVFIVEGEGLDEKFEAKLKELGVKLIFVSPVPAGYFAKIHFEEYDHSKKRGENGYGRNGST
jgi:hypothetical protein